MVQYASQQVFVTTSSTILKILSLTYSAIICNKVIIVDQTCCCTTSRNCQLLNINTYLLNNAVTCLRCGEIFNDCRVGNVLQNVPVEELKKSVNFAEVYEVMKFDGYFCGPPSICGVT